MAKINNEDYLALGFKEAGANVGLSKDENKWEEMAASNIFCVLFDKRHDQRMMQELQFAYTHKKDLVLIVEHGQEEPAKKISEIYPWKRIYNFVKPQELIEIGRQVHELARKREL